MPRCQKTFRKIPLASGTIIAGQSLWQCPFCPEQEQYARIIDADLMQFVAQAEFFCRRDFGSPADISRAIQLYWGLFPECVLDRTSRSYEIYLQQGSDALQVRLQLGHEIFHRTCSQGRIFHWTHEMFACLFSVSLLRKTGALEYADQTMAQYLAESALLPLEAMLKTDVTQPPYPPGFYGRVFQVGQLLETAVGAGRLRRLARRLDARGEPDWQGWCKEFGEHRPFILNQIDEILLNREQ